MKSDSSFDSSLVMDDLKICPHCKSQVPKNAEYCPFCGTPFIEGKNGGKKNYKAYMAIAAVIVAIVIFVSIFVNNDGDVSKPSGQKTQQESGETVTPQETVIPQATVTVQEKNKEEETPETQKTEAASSKEKEKTNKKTDTVSVKETQETPSQNETKKKTNKSEQSKKKQDYPDDGQVFPQSSAELIPYDDIRALSDTRLQDAINEIYARNGYTFKGEEYLAYYKQFSWYNPAIPAESFSPAKEFNDIEFENVERMKKVREERK